MISQISIRNFRSIASKDIPANWITTFVGANDAGKSNVIRALNLFFNGETNPGEPFEFSRDFNQFAEARARKAPQVEIGIRFRLPDTYCRPDQPNEIEWKKVWRREGELTRMETRTFVDGTEFPARSKIPALLDRIRFTYIPAIKDRAFFADLQGRLYDVLSSVAEEPLKESAGAFQTQLGKQLADLLMTLQTAFGAEATMRLPDNLREIFENLEINSGDVPLSRRGDGVKIRHIPMILKFIAVKRDELLTRGGVRYTHLWGFEEPENNVEMSSAFKMVEEFVELISGSEHFQLLVTTHSPIFYRLDHHKPAAKEWLVTHFVSKSGHETDIETRAPEDVDESMGLMPIVAPYVAQAKAKFDELSAQLTDVREIANQQRPTVFVEGQSDQIVLARAWRIFSGQNADAVNFTCGDGAYGGAQAIRSRAIAWLLLLKHRSVDQRVKAAAIFDHDMEGKNARAALGEEITRLKLGQLGFKAFGLRTPKRLVHLAQVGFNLSVDLEALYTDEMWESARDSGWLEPVSHLKPILSDDQVEQLASGGANPFDGLTPQDALRLKHRFHDDGKKRASRRLSTLADGKARTELEGFQPLIADLCDHLGFPKPAG